ncbi:hypothetical protein [Ralstonia phage RP31]|uniref:Uncharacterized protein n=1 Tax=Ralstonia phage RP31 TaxID=1923890 RepID=A0A1L7N1E9_9CAUD|nr:hypothetical protein [Ralstonia phage RP31]
MTRKAAVSKYTSGTKSAMGFSTETDGVDHINIHSMGKTELGQALSHFAHTPFVHPYFGPFYSMEGFWYWARSGFKEDKLRYLSGFRAKQVGKTLDYHWYKDFKEDIIAANYQKIIQHDRIRELMIESELPFDHYYTFGPTVVHVTPQSTDWLVKGFEDIRLALQEGVVPSVWLDAEKRYLKK